jgi:hypothetical protein
MKIMIECDTRSAFAARELQNLGVLRSIQSRINHVQSIPTIGTQ